MLPINVFWCKFPNGCDYNFVHWNPISSNSTKFPYLTYEWAAIVWKSSFFSRLSLDAQSSTELSSLALSTYDCNGSILHEHDNFLSFEKFCDCFIALLSSNENFSGQQAEEEEDINQGNYCVVCTTCLKNYYLLRIMH